MTIDITTEFPLLTAALEEIALAKDTGPAAIMVEAARSMIWSTDLRLDEARRNVALHLGGNRMVNDGELEALIAAQASHVTALMIGRMLEHTLSAHPLHEATEAVVDALIRQAIYNDTPASSSAVYNVQQNAQATALRQFLRSLGRF